MKYKSAMWLLVMLSSAAMAQESKVYLDCEVALVITTDEKLKIGEKTKLKFIIDMENQTAQIPNYIDFLYTSTHAAAEYRIGFGPTTLVLGDSSKDEINDKFLISRDTLDIYHWQRYGDTRSSYEGKCQKTGPGKTPTVIF